MRELVDYNTDLKQFVTAGTPFTIKWIPTTAGPVSILLLKGPSNNVVPVGAPIAESIPNSGSFVWTPPSTFGNSSDGPNGYGIQLIDDVTGQYQYSTQFGIIVPEGTTPSSSSSVAPSSTGGGYPVSTSSSEKVYPTTSVNSTISTVVTTSTFVASTGYPVANSSVILPTKSMTVPSSLVPTATSTTSPPPESTGAAAGLRAGLGLAAGVAGLVFML